MTDSTTTTPEPGTLEAAFREIELLKAENAALRTLTAEQAEQIRIMKLPIKKQLTSHYKDFHIRFV
jgi:hypothetical protein